MIKTILFQCPECRKFFEFDLVREFELVSCPICGNDFQTIKQEGILRLEPFECNSQKTSDQEKQFLLLENIAN